MIMNFVLFSRENTILLAYFFAWLIWKAKNWNITNIETLAIEELKLYIFDQEWARKYLKTFFERCSYRTFLVSLFRLFRKKATEFEF